MSKLSIAVASLALATASLGAPSASQAQISPAPHAFTISGPATLTIAGVPPVFCTATMTFAVAAGGMTGAVTSFSLTGSPVCSTVLGTALPWPVQRIPPGSMPRFEINNIRLTGIFGFCDKGTIRVAWDSTTLPGIGYAETVGTMPGNFSGMPYPTGSCKLDGTWTVTVGGPVAVN